MTNWTIPYGGRDWVFDDTRCTASEARLHKALTGGILPAAAGEAKVQLDPEAWLAALVIARRRSGMDADDAQRVDPDELDLVSALRATTAAAERELQELRTAAANRTAEPVSAPAETAPAAPVADQ